MTAPEFRCDDPYVPPIGTHLNLSWERFRFRAEGPRMWAEWCMSLFDYPERIEITAIKITETA